MYSALWNTRAVAVLFMSSLSGTVAFPQAARFVRRTAEPLAFADIPLVRAPCAREPGSAGADSNAATVASSDLGSPCDTPPLKVPVVNPCNPASPAQIGCLTPRDPVQEDLARMGKAGQKILRAREKVLEILETENACSAWFREKDSNPADIFRTLSFEVDRKAEEFVLKSTDRSNMIIFRNPYVAWVIQGDGRYATITINTNGAFFSPMANMVEVWKEGGPANFRGSHRTNVGPYSGDTIHAQVLTLLHELRHLLDLLPADENHVDAKSAHHTRQTLRYCRAEIASQGRRRAP